MCGGGGGDHEEQHLTDEKSDKTNFPTGFLPWEQNRGGGRGVRAKIKNKKIFDQQSTKLKHNSALLGGD